MTRLFLTIFDYLSAHRRLAAALLVVLVAVAAVMALNVSYEEDIARFLPRNADAARYQAVYSDVSSQSRVAVIVAAADTTGDAPTDSMVTAMDELGARLSACPLIGRAAHVLSEVDASRQQQLLEFAGSHIPYLMTDADYRYADSLLAIPGFVDQRLRDGRDLLMMPTGGMAAAMMASDPLGLFAPVMSRLGTLAMSDRFQLVDGHIITADGRHGLVTFDSPYGPSETARNGLMKDSLDAIIAAIGDRYPTLRISAVGAPLVSVTNARRIKADSLLTMTVAGVLILLLLYLHYRRVSDLLWIAASLGAGWLTALAAMSVVSGSVSLIVLGLGSVVIGIAVNYPLHFLDHLHETGDRREALREMVPPLLIGNITTVAAFLSLTWLDARAMRDLGLFGALMLAGTILFVLVFLPLFAGKPAGGKRRLDLDVDFLPMRTPRQRRVFAITVALLTVVFGWLSMRTSFDADLQNINYMTADQRRDMKMLASTVREAPVYAVAEGRTLDEAMARSRRLTARLDTVGGGTRIDGPAQMIRPDTDGRTWSDFWARHRHAIDTLKASARRLGYADDAFEPFLRMATTPVRTASAAEFEPLLSLMRGVYIVEDSAAVRVVNYVASPHTERVKAAAATADGCYAFTPADMSNQLVTLLSDSFNYIGIVCGLVVFLFLWISFGRIELALLSFLPLAVGWVWILGMMELADVRFNIVNVILATFIFGQGDDYTIFITEGLLYEYKTGQKRLASYKRSVALSGLLMFVGMGCLIFARHPALRSLGEVTVIGMFTVVFMAYYLPPVVFGWLTTRQGRRRDQPLTLRRMAFTLAAMARFLAVTVLWLLPCAWIHAHRRHMTPRRRLRFHEHISRGAGWLVSGLPGVRLTVDNPSGEDFSRPAVIVCNHQSQLDVPSLLQLNPKMVFLTKDWVWKNPSFGYIVRQAEFYPVSQGIENILPRLRQLFAEGYSVCVFPEGTRSADGKIGRFHVGAFYLARMLRADILPVFIHGSGHVLPKHELVISEGGIHVEIGKRHDYAATPVDPAFPERRDLLLRRVIHAQYLDRLS